MSFNKWHVIGACALGAVVGTVLTAGAIVYTTGQVTKSTYDTARFLRTMRLLESRYNGDVTTHQLFEGALKGMTEAAGDPYTVYLDEKDYKALSESTAGSFGGIGIVFGKRGDDYVVISALPDSPGAKAGVKSGDIIVGVNDEDTATMNMEQVANKIRGQVDTEVILSLKDKNGNVRKVPIGRKEIKTPSIGAKMLEVEGKKIGYIRIAIFNETTAGDFAKEYAKLEEEGMQATLIDLRGNPGGLLDSVVEIAKKVVPKGPIVSTVTKDGEKQEELSDLEEIKYPLAVLVDHGSASASEILAGAVKDTKAGRLFGVKTFGKGSVQSVYNLGRNTAVKITIAKYYTPSGVSIHNVGIEPDEVVELPDDYTQDTQLEAAQNYLVGELNK